MRAFLVLAAAVQAGCATPPDRTYTSFDTTGLPPPDVALSIEGLGPCTDHPDRTLHLKRGEPVTVMTHGCFSSAGRFRALAEVFAFHGQQTACYDYDYRDSLMDASSTLRAGLERLSEGIGGAEITLLAHSQGGLIGRKALVVDRPDPIGETAGPIRLVTVSAPYGGIASAGPCGWTWLNVATLGLQALACRAVSGEKWFEITDASAFIREPGRLAAPVTAFLKVDTDERDSCRARADSGRCIEDDYVFSLAEQANPALPRNVPTGEFVIKAGHVEVVGDREVAPVKLIRFLQEQGVLRPTAVARRPDLDALLERLY